MDAYSAMLSSMLRKYGDTPEVCFRVVPVTPDHIGDPAKNWMLDQTADMPMSFSDAGSAIIYARTLADVEGFKQFDVYLCPRSDLSLHDPDFLFRILV